jgi:hypothetical protein
MPFFTQPLLAKEAALAAGSMGYPKELEEGHFVTCQHSFMSLG